MNQKRSGLQRNGLGLMLWETSTYHFPALPLLCPRHFVALLLFCSCNSPKPKVLLSKQWYS